jgi:hypothetical protein
MDVEAARTGNPVATPIAAKDDVSKTALFC